VRELIVLLVLGRVVIWAAQTSGPTQRFWNLHPILTDFGECDFCLGFWVYMALAMVLGVNVLEPDYFPFIAEVVTGAAISFAMHLARLGWTTRFGVLDLTED
jgi:hypothetical protein